MFGKSIRIATVWGIPIKLHASLLLVLLYLLLVEPIRSAADMLFVLVLQALLLVSIAAHELGHSFVAMRKGCRVREITLLFMGGAAQMEYIPARPRDEIQMALAGPAVSLAIGLAARVGLTALVDTPTLAAVEEAGLVAILVFIVSLLNLMLAVFNLLPAFPMDGGRVLRAVLTPRLGRLRATYVASRLGRLLAVGLVVIGVLDIPGLPVFRTPNPFIITIGFLVFILAGREYKMVRMEYLTC